MGSRVASDLHRACCDTGMPRQASTTPAPPSASICGSSSRPRRSSSSSSLRGAAMADAADASARSTPAAVPGCTWCARVVASAWLLPPVDRALGAGGGAAAAGCSRSSPVSHSATRASCGSEASGLITGGVRVVTAVSLPRKRCTRNVCSTVEMVAAVESCANGGASGECELPTDPAPITTRRSCVTGRMGMALSKGVTARRLRSCSALAHS